MPGKEYQPLIHQCNHKSLASSTDRQKIDQQRIDRRADSQTVLRAINRRDFALQSVCRQLAQENRLTTPVASKLLKYGLGKSAYRRAN